MPLLHHSVIKPLGQLGCFVR